MNTGQEHNQLEDLQHEAEHTRPPKRGGAVMGYLVVLFGAAFLLLLMSYFMQQRTNREAMDDLQQTSSSAVQSLENLIAERDALKRQVSGLEEQVADLESELEAAKSDITVWMGRTEDNYGIIDALDSLNHVRALYNKHRNQEARAYIAGLEQIEGVDVTEYYLQIYVNRGSGAAEWLETYNPLEAWWQLKEWLE